MPVFRPNFLNVFSSIIRPRYGCLGSSTSRRFRYASRTPAVGRLTAFGRAENCAVMRRSVRAPVLIGSLAGFEAFAAGSPSTFSPCAGHGRVPAWAAAP
jgi:hypothetical protein